MLIGLSIGAMALLILAGVGLDMRLGEATRWHPLTVFRNLATGIEKRFNTGNRRLSPGTAAWMCAVLPPVLLTWIVTYLLAMVDMRIALALHALLLYFCLGLRSLRDHAMPIAQALINDELPQARVLAAHIFDCEISKNAQESDLAKAVVESLLKNGNDVVFGTLFWFVVAGAPGAVLFRLANTLDAMWGCRTAGFNEFGCTAARVGDVLNFIPARLTALSYGVLGNSRLAWRCWRSHAADRSDPSAGSVISAGAGALGVSLGGAGVNGDKVVQRPPLGIGPPATGADIARAWTLVKRTTLLWLALICIAGVIHA